MTCIREMTRRAGHSAGTVLLILAAGCSGGGGADAGGGGGGGSSGEGNPLAISLDFEVTNESGTERTETVRASIPFPKGGYTSLSNLIVSGHQTAWLPMQVWSDGTVKMAQAQFTDTFAANEIKTYHVARDEVAMSGSFVRHPWVTAAGAALELGAEVRDTFNVDYRGLATGEGETLQDTPLVRVKRWRTYHLPVAGPGIGRDYLTSTFYVTEFRDMPFMVVDWLVGNDYLGADTIPSGNTDPNLRPLGCVDVRRASFLVKGASGAEGYRPAEEGIGAGALLGDGFTAFQVMQDTFLDDAQTRRYRFLLRFEPNGASLPEVNAWRATATAMLEDPFYPLATQRTWQETKAGGLLGGPIAGPVDAPSRAAGEYASWAGSGVFGTWGPHGDVLITATTGTPRNTPLSADLAHAIQGDYPRLVQKLEQMAWIQAARPYHLYGLHVGAEEQILLWDGVPIYPGSRDLSNESLGRRSLVANDPHAAYHTLNAGQPRAHGFEHFDHEHFSMDALFDYWCISGDAWAREEIRQLGESLKALMRLRQYATATIQAARAEGWCMQGFAQAYQVTQDPAMKDYAMRRAAEIVDVERNKTHPSKAMTFQGNYSGTYFPMPHTFYMPWQHGAVLYGYLGAYKAFEDPLMLQIAEDVVDAVEYAWVSNFNDPVRGFVAQGLRYYVPITYNGNPIPASFWDNTPGIGIRWGDSPLGGAHTFLIGGLAMLSQMGSTATVRSKAQLYGGYLLGTVNDLSRWDKWVYCVPASMVQ